MSEKPIITWDAVINRLEELCAGQVNPKRPYTAEQLLISLRVLAHTMKAVKFAEDHKAQVRDKTDLPKSGKDSKI